MPLPRPPLPSRHVLVATVLSLLALGTQAAVPVVLSPVANQVYFGTVPVRFNTTSGPNSTEYAVIHIRAADGSFNRTIELAGTATLVPLYSFDVNQVNATTNATKTTPDNLFVPANGTRVHVLVQVKYLNNATNYTSTAVENVTVVSSCIVPGLSLVSNCTTCLANFNATAAANCTVCDVNRFGVKCELSAAQCRTSRCSAAGNCTGEQSGCLCDSARFGASCSQTATACATARCSSRGACSGQTSGCICNATLNYGGTNCSACADNFVLDEGDQSCGECEAGFFTADCSLNQTQCRASLCSSRGSCAGGVAATCTCDGPFNGSTCATHRCGPYGNGTGTGSAARCTCNPRYVYDPVASPAQQCVPECDRGCSYVPNATLCLCADGVYIAPWTKRYDHASDTVGTEVLEVDDPRLYGPLLVALPGVSFVFAPLLLWGLLGRK